MTTLKGQTRVVSTAGTSPTPQCYGLYQGSVANINDPLQQGRVQVYVPQVLGTAVSNWAKTLGDSPLTSPVTVGQYVFVMFIGGDRNQPTYIPQNWLIGTHFTLPGSLTVNSGLTVVAGGATITGGATIDIVNAALKKYKTSNTTIMNTTVTTDPHLTGFAIAAAGIYVVEVVLNVAGTGTGNIQYQFTIPTGAAGNYVVEQFTIGGLFQFFNSSAWTMNNTASTTASGANGIKINGILDNTGNPAGTMSFQWAQNTNNGSTTVGQYSYMKLERIA